MKNVIELTAAELEMIESKRQMQAELDAKKEAAAEAEFAKAKTQAQNIVAKKIAEGKEQVAIANEFASALGSKYVKKVQLYPIVEKAYKRDYNTHRADEESAVVFEGEYSEAVISREAYTIKVIEHLVYSDIATVVLVKGIRCTFLVLVLITRLHNVVTRIPRKLMSLSKVLWKLRKLRDSTKLNRRALLRL
jgi:hypothetical protein